MQNRGNRGVIRAGPSPHDSVSSVSSCSSFWLCYGSDASSVPTFLDELLKLFHYDAGLFLTAAQLAVDVRRRQPWCFVSHAHSDHIARHELALATTGTACLYRHRMGPRHRVLEMEYREPLDIRRPAAHGLFGRPLPRLGDAAGGVRRAPCSTRATSNSTRRSPPSRPNCRTPTF